MAGHVSDWPSRIDRCPRCAAARVERLTVRSWTAPRAAVAPPELVVVVVVVAALEHAEEDTGTRTVSIQDELPVRCKRTLDRPRGEVWDQVAVHALHTV